MVFSMEYESDESVSALALLMQGKYFFFNFILNNCTSCSKTCLLNGK